MNSEGFLEVPDESEATQCERLKETLFRYIYNGGMDMSY